MYGEVLQVILDALESEHGVFGYIDKNENYITPSMTRDIWDQCRMPEKDIVFPKDSWGGIWGKALTEKKTFYSNESFNVPEGHLPVKRALCVPILHKGELIGLITVGNKKTDYNENDRNLLDTIAANIAPVLKARLERDKMEEKRKNAEERIIEERNLAELYLDLLGHDINNINQAIISSSELLLMKANLPKGSTKYVKNLLQQARRISTMVSNVRKLSELKEKDFKMKKIDLYRIINNTIDRINQVYPERKIRIDHNISDKEVLIESNELVQDLVDNIIGNAVKYDRKNDVVVEIAHSLEQDGAFWKLEFKDHGPGVSDDMKSRIFKRLERGDESVYGSGLGLTIVNEVVERSGGMVWVEDRVKGDSSQGSNFVVKLLKAS
ncbi:MAG: GAF domain-containing sensor histidine kinase [Thermoplasmata archaeon]|nr:MAG: GAF domain-containing sensor histidine kinase [Thermoplasmata archaeon]